MYSLKLRGIHCILITRKRKLILGIWGSCSFDAYYVQYSLSLLSLQRELSPSYHDYLPNKIFMTSSMTLHGLWRYVIYDFVRATPVNLAGGRVTVHRLRGLTVANLRVGLTAQSKTSRGGTWYLFRIFLQHKKSKRDVRHALGITGWIVLVVGDIYWEYYKRKPCYLNIWPCLLFN